MSMKNSNETIGIEPATYGLKRSATRVLARFIAVRWPVGRCVVTVHAAMSRPI
jgi:hypothetical protein